MKKVFAVLVALSLILSCAVMAFAAGTWTGSITIESAPNVSVDGKIFNAYQILAAEAVDADDLDAGVIYSIPAELQSFYNELLGKAEGETATVAEVTAHITALDAEGLREFAVDALAAAKAAGIDAEVAEGEDGEATFDNLAFGYYVIEDASTEGVISALMLRSSSETVTIKADKPSIDKKIDGDIDFDGTTTGLVDYNTATVGEEVPYVLTSKVPVMAGYTAYTYTVTDTFSAGLTFNNDVAVTVGGAEYTDYTVTENGQVVTITFNDFIDLADKKGAEIKITYSATVNENAIIGVEGNPNEVYLTYSNNPQENTTEDTNKDVVRTYLVDLIINKTDENDAPLEGAKFAITQKDENGADVTIATGTSNETGKVVFAWTNGVGLKDGETYTIVETDAPDGYNVAENITFTVTCTDPVAGATNENCTWASDNNVVTFTVVDGTNADYFETTIINRTGSLLPSTGGIGTTIFYIVGIVLMVGACVVLVSKKRMAAMA